MISPLWDDYKYDYIFEESHPLGPTNDTWTTRDGRRIKIEDMTTGHIRNCMRMLGEENDVYYIFREELKRRGVLA